MAHRSEMMGDLGFAELEEKYHHPDLHSPDPELRIHELMVWEEGLKTIEHRPPEELVVLRHEIEELPEVQAGQHERISLDSVRSVVEVFRQRAPEKKQLISRLENVVGILAHAVDEYTNVVGRFVVARTLRERDPERYGTMFKQMDMSRKKAHDFILDAIDTVSVLTRTKIPQEMQGAGFNIPAWRQTVNEKFFPPLKKTNTERDDIREWAVRVGATEKSKKILSAVQSVLEHAPETSAVA